MLPECQLFGTLGCHLCEVAEALLDQGAGAILKAVYGEAGHE